jgi:hypothetical protein
MRKLKFRVGSAVEWRTLVLFTHVQVAPVIIWFDVMHGVVQEGDRKRKGKSGPADTGQIAIQPEAGLGLDCQ